MSGRTDNIEATARESGIAPADVKAILDEYQRQQLLAFPGIIRPERVPFLHTPVQRTLRWIAPFLPFAGVIQAFFGYDLDSGRRLGPFERSMMVLLDLLPVGVLVRTSRRISRPVVVGIARLATSLRIPPPVLLPLLNRLGRIGLKSRTLLRSAYGKILRGGSLTPAEKRVLKEVIQAAPSSTTARVVPRSAAAKDMVRKMSPALVMRLLALHPALPKYLASRPKISLDEPTLKELAALFKATSRSGGTYQAARAAAGELAVLELVHKSGSARTIRLLRPSNRAGSRTPDLAVESTTRGIFYVESTTPTLARRGQRGPLRDGGSYRRIPPADKSRPATNTEIAEAISRKLDRHQLSSSRPGVIAVHLQRVPKAGPLLTDAQIKMLEAKMAQRPHVWEVVVSVPTRAGRRVLRVGTRDSRLGIAQGDAASFRALADPVQREASPL